MTQEAKPVINHVVDVEKLKNFSSFSLKTLDGGQYDLESRRGQPLTAVIFFSTENPRSKDVLVEMAKLKEKYKDKGFDVVAVSAEHEKLPDGFFDTLKEYLKDTGVDFPIAIDEGLLTFRAWEVKAFPTTILVGKDLDTIKYDAGAPSTFALEIIDDIEKNLGIAKVVTEAEAKSHVRYQASKPAMLGFGMAQKLGERGKTSKALADIEKVLKDDPNFPDAHTLRGMLILEDDKGDKNVAREEFAKTLDLNPDFPMAKVGMAHFLLLDGDIVKACELLKEAFARDYWVFFQTPSEQDRKDATAFVEEAQKASAENKEATIKDLQELVGGILELKAKTKIHGQGEKH